MESGVTLRASSSSIKRRDGSYTNGSTDAVRKRATPPGPFRGFCDAFTFPNHASWKPYLRLFGGPDRQWCRLSTSCSATTIIRPVRKRDDLKSPVLENCTPGSVRGVPGNWHPYLALPSWRPVPRPSRRRRFVHHRRERDRLV